MLRYRHRHDTSGVGNNQVLLAKAIATAPAARSTTGTRTHKTSTTARKARAPTTAKGGGDNYRAYSGYGLQVYAPQNS